MAIFLDKMNYRSKTLEKNRPRPTQSWAFLFAGDVSECWCSHRLLGTRLNRCTNSEGKQGRSCKYLYTQTLEIHLLKVHVDITLGTYGTRGEWKSEMEKAYSVCSMDYIYSCKSWLPTNNEVVYLGKKGTRTNAKQKWHQQKSRLNYIKFFHVPAPSILSYYLLNKY